jgi:2-oxoisovalerate dehydrogenase E1 component
MLTMKGATHPHDRAIIIDDNFIQRVKNNNLPTLKNNIDINEVELTADNLIELFESQIISRHLDLISRELKQQNLSYYTIGSGGHEGNAAIAKVFRSDDIAFLHYRSGAFMVQRYCNNKKLDPIKDILLSLMAKADDPIAQGRHKVFGNVQLMVPPQTSTIASHLPKAVGAAASIKRAQTLQIEHPLKNDGVVLCSFGDASINHSTALGAINTTRWIANSHYPLPIVFICEDNGWGISVKTPDNWVQNTLENFAEIAYVYADGLNVLHTYHAAKKAEHIARIERRPVFLHMQCVRLLGHAGSDFELHYRSMGEIEDAESHDPLLYSAAILLSNNVLTQQEIINRYKNINDKIHQIAKKLVDLPQLKSAKAVMQSIIPPKRKVTTPALRNEQARRDCFGDKFAKTKTKNNLSQSINLALTDLMLQYKNIIIFGEDVAKKGGVYRVTADLLKTFGPARVFDTLLDEQTILGQAIGHAHNGFLPIPEIQFLAYLHNAEDQLRGEAATLPFFSSGKFSNPMVLRIASYAYQKGFGGHFHNDNSIAVLRDIPGVIVATPSRGDDAVKMLRSCVELAHQEQRVVVFLEPIALYMTKDLHEEGDGGWLADYPAFKEKIKYGELGVSGDQDAKTAIITYGNGHYISQQAVKKLREQYNKKIKLIDLRWLVPLPIKAVIEQIRNCKEVLIVDECRRTGSLSEEITACLHEEFSSKLKISRLTAQDSFISLGNSWQYLLPSKEQVIQALVSCP